MTDKPLLKNDYERMVPEFHKGSVIYGEHLVRYAVAQELVSGKVVLDIASGSGYGTYALAGTAKKVFGVDVSANAVAYAEQNYKKSNIEYRQGDGTSIPLKTNSIDIAVSFETIEHIEDYKTFMQEIKRVLKPSGLFLLSTPNDTEFAEGNHYHIHQFKHQELTKLVQGYFTDIKEYFQANWIYSGVHHKEELTNEWQKNINIMNVAPLNLNQVLYFFMLCADREITEKIETIGAFAEHSSARAVQKKENLTQRHITNLTDLAESRLAYIRKLEEDIGTLNETIRQQLQQSEEDKAA